MLSIITQKMQYVIYVAYRRTAFNDCRTVGSNVQKSVCLPEI